MNSKRFAALWATIGVGAVAAAIAITVAIVVPTAAQAAVSSQRIVTVHSVAPAHTTFEVQAPCNRDELVSGGGYQVGSIGFNDKVYVNAPLNKTTWLVEIINDTAFPIDVWAFAVCLK